eukprot:4353987-Pyramimonas_sp.AAC.1
MTASAFRCVRERGMYTVSPNDGKWSEGRPAMVTASVLATKVHALGDQSQGIREHIPGVGTNHRGLEGICDMLSRGAYAYAYKTWHAP